MILLRPLCDWPTLSHWQRALSYAINLKTALNNSNYKLITVLRQTVLLCCLQNFIFRTFWCCWNFSVLTGWNWWALNLKKNLNQHFGIQMLTRIRIKWKIVSTRDQPSDYSWFMSFRSCHPCCLSCTICMICIIWLPPKKRTLFSLDVIQIDKMQR